MSRRLSILVLIVLLLALVIWIDQPNHPNGLKIGEFTRTFETVLGLDLRGGMQVLLEVDLPAEVEVDPQSLQDARQILENRSNGLGVSEVVFQVAGNRRIVGEFPGLTNTDQVIAVLKETGQLEFVDFGTTRIPDGTSITTSLGGSTSSITPTQAIDFTATPVTSNNSLQPTAQPTETVWTTVMTGTDLKTVSVTTDNLGQPVVSFELTTEGQRIFADYTTNNVGKILGIVLDKKVISSPQIDEPITQGSGIIRGNFSFESANALAIQLRYGSLPIPLKVVESRIIGPTLGEDSLRKSMIAGLVGFAIVALFMLLYYRLPGGVAIVAIFIYALITLALYKLIPVTLTLPGIAGFLLSTGGALDANILMFERLKEELRAGRNLRTALDLAWKRAWPSIRDSNIATIITSIILFWFGSAFGASIVKGFSLTLALGVIISLFSAIVITRTLLSLVAELTNPADHAKWFGA
jgi:preprotein translocase subunit SecD